MGENATNREDWRVTDKGRRGRKRQRQRGWERKTERQDVIERDREGVRETDKDTVE